MMEIVVDHKFIVRADFYGDIPSNEKKSFWLPLSRGFLYFSRDCIHYREFASAEDLLTVQFEKIIKVKKQTLNPRKNQWLNWVLGNPYYLLFWNPFWNRFLVNITFIGEHAQPRELFFKLNTRKITEETMAILKKMLSASVVIDN